MSINEELDMSGKELISITISIYLIIGFAFGIGVSILERSTGNDGCVYRSAGAFINPGYNIACEIARVRFNKQAPIEYKTIEVKKI